MSADQPTTGRPATDLLRLDGRVAVVTGAASGIGRATALRLAEAGASVVLGDVDEAGLEETKELAGEVATSAVAAAVTDVSVRGQVDALVAAAVNTLGGLDVMANVAGIMRNAPLADLTEDEFDAVIGVNLKGVLFGTQAALRAMADAGRGGSIVTVASAAIDMPAAGYGAYAVSKAGVAMLTRTAAVEGGRHGIRVNAVAPGFVETPMTQRWFRDAEGSIDEEGRSRFLEAAAGQTPLRVTGDPDDIALTIAFLASDAARYTTGQIMRPNGGVVMPW